MYKLVAEHNDHWICKSIFFNLSFFSIAGFFIGCLAGERYQSSFSLMHHYFSSPVSIVGMFFICVLPFLFAALAVYMNKIHLLFSLVLLRAASFGYCSVLLIHSFSDCGWLVRFFLLFAQVALLPAYFFFILHGVRKRHHLAVGLLIMVAYIGVVVCLDFFVVSPYLAFILLN